MHARSPVDSAATVRQRRRVVSQSQSPSSGASPRRLSLRDMTEGTGCTPRTVRYYERQGLLRANRTSGGHRQFAPSELERLGFIIALREAGWSLEDVTTLLEVRDTAPSDASATAHLTRLLEAQIDALARKLVLLQRLRDEFGETADLLAVCQTCTSVQTRASCEGCDRLPELSALPRPFRLIWRAHELDGGEAFDDAAADDDDAAVV